MKNIRLFALWDNVRSSYWFVPSLMAAAIVLSFVTVALDDWAGEQMIQQVGFLWSGGPEGARSLLATVAGSMITVAGVIFSLTIATYSQAAINFGPRLLRTFMRDRGNQIVLGTFVSTFIYCLLILRTVRFGEESSSVPHISVTIGIILALASLGVLIYFIHHVTTSIQAPIVVADVANDLFETIERVFPAGVGEEPARDREQTGPADVPGDFDPRSAPILASSDGYLQAIDNERLLRAAHENGLILRIMKQPGNFIIAQTTLAYVWPKERLSQELKDEIEQVFILGKQETHTQDVEFVFGQLVDVAIRALSPSMNDPMTAATCLDWLGAALCRLAKKPLPSGYRYDYEGHLRVIIEKPTTFPGIVDIAFDQIRRYADSHVLVRKRLMDMVNEVAAFTENDQDRAALFRQARLIEKGSRDHIQEPADRQEITDSYRDISLDK